MGAVEDLVLAVEGSSKLDAGAKGMTVAFLKQAGPAIGVLAPLALSDLLRQLAGGQRAAAVATISGAMTQAEVVSLLGLSQQQMDEAAAGRAEKLAAGRALVGALESAALTAMMQAIASAL